LWVLGVFVVAGVAMSFVFFGLWTELADALPPEAEQAFTAALAKAGGGPPSRRSCVWTTHAGSCG
jgi:hypothetical protein